MKKYIAPTLLVLSVTFAVETAPVEAWEWNPSKLLTPPTWITTPVTATTKTVSTATTKTVNATTRTTKSAWRSVSKGTSTAWKKTTSFLDPFPNDQPAATKPTTPGEFFNQPRPE